MSHSEDSKAPAADARSKHKLSFVPTVRAPARRKYTSDVKTRVVWASNSQSPGRALAGVRNVKPGY